MTKKHTLVLGLGLALVAGVGVAVYAADDNAAFADLKKQADQVGKKSWDELSKEGQALAKKHELLDIMYAFKLRKGKSVAEVELAVPDTRLAGEVVDEAGSPVNAAEVLVVGTGTKRPASQLRTDEEGKFLARGLSPGMVLVRAEAEDRHSDFIPASLVEEGESPWLRIVVRRLQTFNARIVSVSGGVPGVLVRARAAFDAQGAAATAQGVSGPDGRLDLRLPGDVQALHLTVLPPGYAMRLLTVPVTPGREIEIPVEPQGGTLVLAVDLAETGPSPLLVHGGTFTLVQELKAWARLAGERLADPERLVLPNAESGQYSLCLGGGSARRLREGGEPPAANCASGVLSPHGELILRAPQP